MKPELVAKPAWVSLARRQDIVWRMVSASDMRMTACGSAKIPEGAMTFFSDQPPGDILTSQKCSHCQKLVDRNVHPLFCMVPRGSRLLHSGAEFATVTQNTMLPLLNAEDGGYLLDMGLDVRVSPPPPRKPRTAKADAEGK